MSFLERIVQFSVNQRLLVLIAALVLLGGGVYSASRLPIDAIPDITSIQVQINTKAPGLTPVEVEQLVTYSIEIAMTGLPRVADMRSLSRFALSQVTVVFEEGTDIYWARQLVFERLQEAKENLPVGVETPELAPVSTGLGEIYQFLVKKEPGAVLPASLGGASGGHSAYLKGFDSDLTGDYDPSAMDTRTLLDWYIAPQLRSVPGVIEVNSFGGYLKQYQVAPDPVAMASLGISMTDLFEALERNNRNAGGAYIERQGQLRLVRGVGLMQGLDDIRNVVLRQSDGVPVKVRDVAEVALAPAVRYGAVTKDGKGEVTAGIVMMLIGANSRQVAQAVHAKAKELNKTLPPGFSILPFYNRSELVNETIKTVLENLGWGGALVVIILLLLLGNLRAAVISAVTIPLAMSFALIGMRHFKIPASLMSLGALDFGLIVDGAVIMVENIIRQTGQRQQSQNQPLSRTELVSQVASSARSVAHPILFGMLIITLVYVPIMTLHGIEGKMFRPMAFTTTLALVGAIVLTLTVIPALCASFLYSSGKERENPLMAALRPLYRKGLAWFLRQRSIAAFVAFLAVGGGLALFPLLGSEFMPELFEGDFVVNVVRPASTSLTNAVRNSTTIERLLRSKFPAEVKSALSKTGQAEIATDPMGPEMTDVLIKLAPRGEWRRASDPENLQRLMSQELRKVPGIAFTFSQPIRFRMNELMEGIGVRAELAVKVFGSETEGLTEQAERIADTLRRVKGASEVRVEQVSGLPMLQVSVDRNSIARYGINVDDVQQIVEAGIGGSVSAGQIIEGVPRVDLVVRYPRAYREDPSRIRNLFVSTPDGAMVPLSELASIQMVEGPSQISRERGERRVSVECNVRGRDMGGFVAEAQSRIDKAVQIPPGYRLEWAGQFKHLQEARGRLLLVVPLTLALIFLILFTTFNSMRQAILVFTGIPFSILGGTAALLFRGLPFTISAGVGFIALSGIAVLDAVIMVSYINELRRKGASVGDAVLNGAVTRLRPMLMATLVATLGYVPMALNTGIGAEVQRPLATVVVGGLLVSTLLTLFVLPTFYRWVEEPRTKVETKT